MILCSYGGTAMFAKNLKYLRQLHNIDQLQLAEALGRKSASSISEWESGKYTPKIGVLSMISSYFNVDLDDMMTKDLELENSNQSWSWSDQTNTSNTSDERTKRLRKAVENSGYSQTQLCEITGINKGALSSYLSGRYYPKQQAIEKLSEALNVPIFWLMGYDTENEEDSQEENAYYIDKEARELAQFLYENPKYKILFDAAKDVSADDLEMVKTIIDKFKK